jgi:hypothetical protein
VRLQRRSGATIRFARLSDLFDGRAQTRIVSIQAATQFMPLTNADAVKIAQEIIAFCEAQALDELDEARQWVREFVEELGDTIDATLEGTTAKRWKSLTDREDKQEKLASKVIAARTIAMRDERGRLWLPAGPLRQSISAGGKGPDWPHIIARMAEIGWDRMEVDMWQPGAGREGRELGARRVQTVFFVAPEDWT